MSLDQIKKLEDLKKEKNELYSKLIKKIADKAKILVNNAFGDFESFYKNNGFAVKKEDVFTKNIIKATYGEINVILSYDFKTHYMGAYELLDLEVFNKYKKNYTIYINPNEYASSLLNQLKKGISAENEDEIIKESIQIKNLANEIEKSCSIEVGYFLLIKENDVIKFVPYSTICEILSEVI